MRSKAVLESHPIHPMLVSFPIGLWVTALIFNLLGASRGSPALWAAGFYCIIAGCIGAALAAVPGLIDWLTVVPPQSSAKRRGLLHGSLNSLNLLLFIYIAYRLGSPATQPDGFTLFLMVVGIIILGIAGWLGGTLVYRNQIGVDRRYASAGTMKMRTIPNWSRPVCNQSELADGQMLLAIIGSDRVVVGRCAQGFYAFSDHCSHRGGPLYDGALVDCTVQCPWHGSQFDVRSGRVVAGPAEEKIKIYNVETRAGEIYVKEPLKPEIVPPRRAA